MKTMLLLSGLLLLNMLPAAAQITPARKTFHAHYSQCNFIGTKEMEFVLELVKDSAVKISVYSSDFHDGYNAVLRTTYAGTASRKGDTLQIHYYGRSTEIKRRNSQQQRLTPVEQQPNFYGYPDAAFVLKENTLMAVAGMFPTLKRTAALLGDQLDMEFSNWDKNTFLQTKELGQVRIFGLHTAIGK